MNIEKSLQSLESMAFSDTKVILTDNMFHITIWNQMNYNQKIRLLQTLENNLSCKDGRAPSKIKNFLKLPNLACASRLTGEIKVSQWHFEMGFNGLNDLNAQAYCAICHEHEHFSQFLDADSDKIDKKSEECRVNLESIIPYSGSTVQEYVEYRVQPIEYYAHKLSEEHTIATFARLEREFGKDIGFREWYDIISSVSLQNLTKLYNQEYGTTYTFEELYSSVLDKINNNNKESNVKIM